MPKSKKARLTVKVLDIAVSLHLVHKLGSQRKTIKSQQADLEDSYEEILDLRDANEELARHLVRFTEVGADLAAAFLHEALGFDCEPDVWDRALAIAPQIRSLANDPEVVEFKQRWQG